MAKANSSNIANKKEETNWTDFMNFLYINRGKVAWLVGAIITIGFFGYRIGRFHERYVADKELMDIRREHDKEMQRMNNDMLLIRIESLPERTISEVRPISEPNDEQ